MLQAGEGCRSGRRLNSARIFSGGAGRLSTDGPDLRHRQPLNYIIIRYLYGHRHPERVWGCHWEFAMPDLDLIKQGEQGVRVRRYRIFDHLKTHRHCEPLGRRDAPPRTGSAKQSRAATPLPVEIASSRRGAPHNDAAPSWSRPNRCAVVARAEAGEQIVVTRADEQSPASVRCPDGSR